MTFAYDTCEVFLDDLAGARNPGTGVELCSRHADTRTAPVGWTLHDRRRAGDRHLFIPVEAADVA